MNPVVDLSAVQNLAIDFWVMNRAWLNLSSLQRLRSVRNFCVVMAGFLSPGTYPNFPCTRTAKATWPLFLHDFINIDFQRRDIENALMQYWGVPLTDPSFSTQADAVENLVLSYIPSELITLQLLDTTWWMPPFDFVALERH
jgi:hypothetical protein